MRLGLLRLINARTQRDVVTGEPEERINDHGCATLAGLCSRWSMAREGQCGGFGSRMLDCSPCDQLQSRTLNENINSNELTPSVLSDVRKNVTSEGKFAMSPPMRALMSPERTGDGDDSRECLHTIKPASSLSIVSRLRFYDLSRKGRDRIRESENQRAFMHMSSIPQCYGFTRYIHLKVVGSMLILQFGFRVVREA